MITRLLAEYEHHQPTLDALAQRLERELSLAQRAQRPDVAALDDAVSKALGRPRASEPYFPGYLLKLLQLAGLGTTDALQEALDRHGAQVVDAVGPYFEFARRAWQLEPGSLEAVHSGYSLFFLAHLAILKGPELGLSKVARLTRLYEALDEPGDERSAHEVASGLVAALGS